MTRESLLPDDATLLAIPLFSDFTTQELDGLRAMCRVKRYRKNAMIFYERDPSTGLYAMLRGSVKLFKLTPEGKEYIVHLLYPYSLVGEVPMFGGGTYLANAQALEDCTLLFLPKRAFVEFLRHTPALTTKLLTGFAARIRALSDQLENITLHDVSCRLARFLIVRLEEESGTHDDGVIQLRATKSTIAAHLGTTIETLSRTFRALQTEGIIRFKRSTVIVIDLPRLRALAGYTSVH